MVTVVGNHTSETAENGSTQDTDGLLINLVP